MRKHVSIVRWAAAIALCAFGVAVPASAQITTGTVTGTVKDAQGGVVPGATVVLISEARGTKSAAVVTNETGDYVFPNVTPDTYTVEVTMPGFKTLQRTGVAVSGGDRVAVGALALEVGGATETVNVTAEAPLIQAAERRALVHRHHSTRSRTCRSSEPQLRQPHRAHAGRQSAPRPGSAAAARTTS